MKLLTKEVASKLPALYSNEDTKDPTVRVKFFTPDSNWTWFATEGSYVCPEHGNFDCAECPKPWSNFLFFGLVHGLEKELGYFSLSELESAVGPLGLKIERDLYFAPAPLSKFQSGEVR